MTRFIRMKSRQGAKEMKNISHICHIDESGDFVGLSSANPGAQPVLAVVGLIVPEGNLAQMEKEFADLRKNSEFLNRRRKGVERDDFPPEDKGKDMFRLPLRSDDADWQAGALSVLGSALDLLKRAEARAAGCVHIKPVDREFNGARGYVSSVLSVAVNFHRILELGHPEKERDRLQQEGRVICDWQEQAKSSVCSSFCERQFRPPEFEDSRSSAGLQLADWICSGIVAPLAAAACFSEAELPRSVHINPRYLSLREGENSPWARLMRMQFPFTDENGRHQPGILVHPEEFRPRLFASSHL